jgi:hypothetical protein
MRAEFMADSLRSNLLSGHLLSREMSHPAMAKADLTNRENDHRRRFGRVLARAVELASLTNSEAADRLHVDRAQFQRWLSGAENAQVWRFHVNEILGPCLLAAQAEDTEGATIRQIIELQRKVS